MKVKLGHEVEGDEILKTFWKFAVGKFDTKVYARERKPHCMCFDLVY